MVLASEAFALATIADENDWGSLQLMIPNRFEDRAGRMFQKGCANGQMGGRSSQFRAPYTDLQSFVFADELHGLREGFVLISGQVQSAHHGEDGRFVMVIHLDFGDVCAATRHIMNDRIGESNVVGTDGGNDDFHGAVALQQAVEQQAKFSKFVPHIDPFDGAHVDAQGLFISYVLELGDQFAVVDFALADAHLKLVFFGVSQVDMVDVLRQFFVVLVSQRAAQIVAGVEG